MPRAPLVLALLLAASAPVGQAAASPEPTGEQPRNAELRAGMDLEAVRDVTLRDATIAKGSRVRVVRVHDQGGRTVALDVELKDGYVLRDIAFRKVRDNFKPAQ
jgi:hypothetical protein